MLHYRQLWPVLVLVPNEVLAEQWKREILRFIGPPLIAESDIHIVRPKQKRECLENKSRELDC